jgi:hypothetical protein
MRPAGTSQSDLLWRVAERMAVSGEWRGRSLALRRAVPVEAQADHHDRVVARSSPASAGERLEARPVVAQLEAPMRPIPSSPPTAP